MTVSIIGAVTQSGATSKVAQTNTGAADGDLLVFFVSAYGNTASVAAGATTFAGPAGSVFVGSQVTTFAGFSAGPTTVWIYKLRIVGTPASTYTFTVNGDGQFGGTEVATICLRGARDVDTFSSNGNGAGSTNPTAPSLSTSVGNELLILYYWGENQTASAGPAGFTQQLNTLTGNPSASAEGMWTKTQLTSGATGSQTITATSDDWIAVMVAITAQSAVIQNTQVVNAASATTLTATYGSAVIVGSTLWCAVTTHDVTGATISVSDSVNGSWTLLDSIDDSTNATRTAHFYFPNTAAGTPVVTATLSLASTLNAIWISEVNGVTGSPLDGHAGQVQASPGSGTDAVSSSSASNTKQPGLTIGLSVDNRTVTPVAPAAGTAFTDLGAGWNISGTGNMARLESKRVTSVGSQSATFTGTSGVSPTSIFAFFDEIGSSGVVSSTVIRRRALEQVAIDEWAHRVTHTPSAQIVVQPPLLQRHAREYLAPDERSRTSRITATPLAYVPQVPPLSIKRDIEDSPLPDARTVRFSFVPVTSVSAITVLPHRLSDQVEINESANRIKAIPFGSLFDIAPLVNRRPVEQTNTDESASHIKAIPSGNAFDVAPLPIRFAREQVPTDEITQRTRASLAPSTDLTPPTNRRVVEQISVDEESYRIKAIPNGSFFDTSPLVNRRANEVLIVDETTQRIRPVPLGGAAIDSSPLILRKVTEEVSFERFHVSAQRPLPSSDFAPLLGDKSREESLPVEFAKRYQQPAPSTDLSPQIGRRTQSEDGSTAERPSTRSYFSSSLINVVGSPPITMRHSSSTDESPDESVRRPRFIPSPSTSDISPLKNRSPDEEPVIDEHVYRQMRSIPVSFVPSGIAPLWWHRLEEEIYFDEHAQRVRPLPSPTSFDKAPVTNKQIKEDVAPADWLTKRRQVSSPSIDTPQPTARRAHEESIPDEPSRRYQHPAPSTDLAPINGRKAREDGSGGDETVSRYRLLVPSTDMPIGSVRRNREETLPEEELRRVFLVQQGSSQPVTVPRRLVQESIPDERIYLRRYLAARDVAPDFAPLISRRVLEEFPSAERAIRSFSSIAARGLAFVFARYNLASPVFNRSAQGRTSNIFRVDSSTRMSPVFKDDSSVRKSMVFDRTR